MKIILRFKMAWKAFWLISFDYQVEPFTTKDTIGPFRDGTFPQCDNKHRSGCDGSARVCLQEKRATLDVSWQDHYHVCNKCGAAAVGTKEKLG